MNDDGILYTLVHEHKYGTEVVLFRSNEPLSGHWGSHEDIDQEELDKVTDLGVALGLDIDFSASEYIDIETVDEIKVLTKTYLT